MRKLGVIGGTSWASTALYYEHLNRGVAARLGGRVVWMPTVSAPNHKAGASSPELSVHRGFELGPVAVTADSGELLSAWHDVLDVVAEHDLLLASGHLAARETVTLFTAAAEIVIVVTCCTPKSRFCAVG